MLLRYLDVIISERGRYRCKDVPNECDYRGLLSELSQFPIRDLSLVFDLLPLTQALLKVPLARILCSPHEVSSVANSIRTVKLTLYFEYWSRLRKLCYTSILIY